MTSTSLASSIPLLWGEKVNNFFKLKLMLADFFTDRSAELANGGSALYTPNITEMSANAKTNATSVNTMAALISQTKAYIMSVHGYTMLSVQTNYR